MRIRSTIATVSAAVLFCGGAALLAQQAGSDQLPVFRTQVEMVSVDVGVLDRDGRPLRGLAASDFSVTVNGRPRRVVTAEFVDVASARTSAAAPSRIPAVSTNDGAGVGRLIVFVVDEGTIDPGQVRNVTDGTGSLFSGLSFVDRSALILLPLGPNIEFTWMHDKVREALGRAVGRSTLASSSDFGSLSEARDIATGNLLALRNSGSRECGTLSAGGFGAGGGPSGAFPGIGATTGSTGPPTGAAGGGGGAVSGGEQGSGAGTTPAAGGAATGGGGGGTGGGGGRSGGGGGFGDSCTRDVQMRAEWTWRNALMTSLSSVTAFRQVLSSLARIPGDKTVVLVSGGWPLEQREENSLVMQVASEAAAARATIFSFFVPTNYSSVTRRTVNSTPVEDYWLQASAIETLAAMTGGGSFRIVVGADAAFRRLTRELAGYYRIGVEKEPADADAKSQRLKVQVARDGATVRAREIFDARTFDDRNWSARLASALHSPTVATSISLRVTSYLARDPNGTNYKVVLTGEASRVEPGAASFQLLVQDSRGQQVVSGEEPIGEPTGEGLAFSTTLPLAPGSYIVRVAVMDGTGRTGSVDHHVEVREENLGDVSATGPILVRIPTRAGAKPRFALGEARQDERLAMEVHLAGDVSRLEDARVVFEIAQSADGPALVETDASMSSRSDSGWMAAQGLADLRLLPPGDYVTRVRIATAGKEIGQVLRPFVLSATPGGTPAYGSPASPRGPAGSGARPSAAMLAVAPRFSAEDALAPKTLRPFLDRVAARPDAATPSVRDLLDRARGSGVEQLAVTDALAADEPVAAFLKGLALMHQHQLAAAADAFRAAMRAAPDFYPAMVYLGACYAAGGNDKDAAGAWRTALIKESDTRALHVLLIDALLRQQDGELALETVGRALTRWPDDDELKRRFVLAALLAGKRAEALQALDGLLEQHAEDEATLTAGLLALYEAFNAGEPVHGVEDDRARMARLADAYRAAGGQSVALVDTWLQAALKQ